jgi:hypothetical protein
MAPRESVITTDAPSKTANIIISECGPLRANVRFEWS